MSKANTASLQSPLLIDYLLLLAGFALSLAILTLSPVTVTLQRTESDLAHQMIPVLDDWLCLPQGIVLLWPFFLTIQRFRGRSEGLTAAEWLWVFAWLGTALMTGLAAWQYWGTLPGFLENNARNIRIVWYVILNLTMAFFALLFALLGFLNRSPQPWTHSFGIVLVFWPALPLLAILMLGKIG